MRYIFLSIFIWSLVSCTATKKSLREHEGSYLENVKLNFEAGEKALKNKEYDRALAYFQFIKTKYHFSKYVALSDLKIADVKFEQKKWLEAAVAYEVFIRLHPLHEEIAYAYYHLGVSYFFAIPSDFLLYPQPASREQTFTKEAAAALERFILLFPNSTYLADAKEKLSRVYSNLATHNELIGDYYHSRKKYDAAFNRYLNVNELYPDTTESASALLKAAVIAKENLHDSKLALSLLNQIIEQKTTSDAAKKAQDLIAKWQ